MSTTTFSLGDRMKRYEAVSQHYLTRRIPAIIRIDGKAFHTFTRGLNKPFDDILMRCMQKTMQYLCENIQGCVLGYTQSDEITLVLCDYQTITTDAWFGYRTDKMCSVSASMATLAFNNAWRNYAESSKIVDLFDPSISDEERKYIKTLQSKCDSALFDSRVFSVPVEEVTNCLIRRQQDATRNSIESVGQANFSHKELHGKSCNDIQDMLMLQKGINWNDLETTKKRGCCCIRTISDGWTIDDEIPIFTKDRDYIERLIHFELEE